jgi:acyl-CoA reductase-like NAD-dependent aldehyde dehydrogenase
VRDITDGSKLVDEEQFGPVLPIIKFSDSADALRRANASSYGLGGSIWSSNPEAGWRIARCGRADSFAGAATPCGGDLASAFRKILGH